MTWKSLVMFFYQSRCLTSLLNIAVLARFKARLPMVQQWMFELRGL